MAPSSIVRFARRHIDRDAIAGIAGLAAGFGVYALLSGSRDGEAVAEGAGLLGLPFLAVSFVAWWIQPASRPRWWKDIDEAQVRQRAGNVLRRKLGRPITDADVDKFLSSAQNRTALSRDARASR